MNIFCVNNVINNLLRKYHFKNVWPECFGVCSLDPMIVFLEGSVIITLFVKG